MIPRPGCNVQYFKPKKLTLLEFAVLAHVVHGAFPEYLHLSSQCYFYAGLVYAAAEKFAGVLALENADKSGVVFNHGSHLSGLYGRWGGFKVMSMILYESIIKN